MHAWIGRFGSHLTHERRLSGHTVAAYLHDLRELEQFCTARKIARWSALGHAHVRTFAAASHAGGLAARSIQRRLSAVRTFFEFLVREGCCTSNPGEDVRAPKLKKRLPTTLDADQMGRLLAFRAEDSLSARDKAIMSCSIHRACGCRNWWGSISPRWTLPIAPCACLARCQIPVLPIGPVRRRALRQWLANVRCCWAGGGGGPGGAVFVAAADGGSPAGRFS